MKNLSEKQFLNLCVRLDQIGGAAYSGGAGDLSALSEAMELIKDAYIEKQTSEEISKLTNELHALANEVAMHGWDYRPLLKANELLEQAYAAVPEPKKWVVRISTNSRYYDEEKRVKWNNCNLYPKPVPKNYQPGEHEKIIEAPTLGSAFDKMCELYCSDDTDIKLTAIGYFYLQNQK